MPKVNLTHFEAAILFALCTSAVMGIVSKKTDSERLQYGLYLFGCFVASLIGLGWIMRIGHG